MIYLKGWKKKKKKKKQKLQPRKLYLEKWLFRIEGYIEFSRQAKTKGAIATKLVLLETLKRLVYMKKMP